MSVATNTALNVTANLRAFDRWIHRALDHNLVGVRGLTMRRFGWTAIVIAAFTLWSTVGNLLAADGLRSALATVGGHLSYFIPKYTLWMVPAMIVVSIADNLPLEGIRRTLALAAALALSALLEIPVALYRDPCIGDCSAFPAWSDVRQIVPQAIWVFAYTSAIAVAFFAHRRDQTIAAALHDSEMARVDAERVRLKSLLQAMQARVDPAFLLAVLQDVGVRYVSDHAAGARMLDLLIQYLRSALPQMREAHSTLERESSLLRSYLGILAMQSNGALSVACRFDAALAGARVPPMILLPLVAVAAQQRDAAGTATVDAREMDGRVRIVLAAHGAIAQCIAQSPESAEVRERLLAIYGDRASLIVDRVVDDVQLIVEIPHERTDSGRR